MSTSAPGPAAGPTAPPRHAERLLPSAGAWTACCAVALTAGLVPLPVVGPGWALVTALLTVALVAAALAASSPRVAVEDGQLRAGRASIPLDQLGAAEALDAAAMRRAMGPELDARAHLVTRGWVRTGVRVAVADPADPTPYWLVSTRRPRELAAALRQR